MLRVWLCLSGEEIFSWHTRRNKELCVHLAWDGDWARRPHEGVCVLSPHLWYISFLNGHTRAHTHTHSHSHSRSHTLTHTHTHTSRVAPSLCPCVPTPPPPPLQMTGLEKLACHIGFELNWPECTFLKNLSLSLYLALPRSTSLSTYRSLSVSVCVCVCLPLSVSISLRLTSSLSSVFRVYVSNQPHIDLHWLQKVFRHLHFLHT